MKISVEHNANCEGMLPAEFEILGSPSTDQELVLYFVGPDREIVKVVKVVGWTTLGGGSTYEVHTVRARDQRGRTGILIYSSGDCGIRVLDDGAEGRSEEDSHLPPGYGWPILWKDDSDGLPAKVREVLCAREMIEVLRNL